MKDKRILQSIIHTTQMGQAGIRSVLKEESGLPICNDLRDQLKEYDSIEKEAQSIAARNGWEMTDLNPVMKFMSSQSADMRLASGSNKRIIAAMMIRGSARGISKGIRIMQNADGMDGRISDISEKLLRIECANISSMAKHL